MAVLPGNVCKHDRNRLPEAARRGRLFRVPVIFPAPTPYSEVHREIAGFPDRKGTCHTLHRGDLHRRERCRHPVPTDTPGTAQRPPQAHIRAEQAFDLLFSEQKSAAMKIDQHRGCRSAILRLVHVHPVADPAVIPVRFIRTQAYTRRKRDFPVMLFPSSCPAPTPAFPSASTPFSPAYRPLLCVLC